MLCHAVIFALLLARPAKEPPPDRLAVEFLPTREAAKPARHIQGRAKPDKVDLRLPYYSGMPGSLLTGIPASRNNEEQWGGDGGQVRHIESASVLMALAEELDGAMSFPSALGKRQLEGTILARLHFQREGGCDWQRTKIFPGEPHFRIYVLALLKKICGFGQIAKMKFPTTDHADLSFQFRLIYPGENVDPAAGKFITGNVLAFERTWARSPIRLDLGPLTFFENDIVHINFGWLFDQWDKLTGENKDPMREFEAK